MRGTLTFVCFFIISLFVTQNSVLASVQIIDRLTPLIQAFEKNKNHTRSELENIILKYEFALAKEFSALYYDHHSFESKTKLTDKFDRYAKNLPELVIIYKKRLPFIKNIISEVENKYREKFGIELDFPVYIWSALAPTDGKVTNFHGVQGFSLNFKSMADYSDEELRILLAHEFFHLVQNKAQRDQPKGGALEESLFAEGWATYASQIIYPGYPDWKYVSYFEKDDSQFKKFNALEKEFAKVILKNIEQKSDEKIIAKFFSGNPEKSTPWPPRAGYYMGYRLAKNLESAKMGQIKIAKIPFSEFQKHLQPLVSEMAK